MPSPIVVDTSPIIVLAKAAYLDLLRAAGSPIQMPRAVVQEIQQAGPNDVAATLLGIPHRGCLGLVLAARKQGIVALGRPVLEQLRQAGLRLIDRLMNQALALVGE